MHHWEFQRAWPLLFAITTILWYRAHGDCQITREQFDDTRGVLTTLINGKYELLQTPNIKTDNSLYIFLTPQKYVETKCLSTNDFSIPLPIPYVAEPKVIVDPTCQYTMYNVGYDVTNSFLGVYQTCYDKNTLAPVYSESTIYPKKKKDGISDDAQCASRPKCVFSTDDIMTRSDEQFYKKSSYQSKFDSIYGPNLYAPELHRGHLAPSCDFLTFDQSCTTFKYLNVVPQFGSINRGNWLAIESWVRNWAVQATGTTIRTGAIGVLKLPDAQDQLQPAYLGRNNKIPVPEWTYKFVKNTSRNNYAIITYNNVYRANRPPAPKFCKEIICPSELSLKNTAEAGFTYCCDPSKFTPTA